MAAVFAAAPRIRADDSQPDKKAERDRRRDEWSKLTPEERQARSRENDRKRELTKRLSPEEREAKRKELAARLDKRLAALREKQTNGTLTAEEERELSRCDQIRKRFESHSLQTNAPAENPKRGR